MKKKIWNNEIYPWTAIIPVFFLTPILGFIIAPEFDYRIFLSLLLYFVFDGLGIQIGVHKEMAHRSFETYPIIRRVLAFLSVLSGQGSPITWVAVHMSGHHPNTDTEKDVHSPNDGLFYAFIAWYWRVDPKKIKFLVAKRYIKDKYLLFLHNNHSYILLGYWFLLAVFSWQALFYFGLLPAFLSIVLVGFVNCFMHSTGKLSHFFFQKYQSYPGSTTYNSVWLGFMTMGLGLHNNHHKYPDREFNDIKWYELDLSRLIIPLIKKR